MNHKPTLSNCFTKEKYRIQLLKKQKTPVDSCLEKHNISTEIQKNWKLFALHTATIRALTHMVWKQSSP